VQVPDSALPSIGALHDGQARGFNFRKDNTMNSEAPPITQLEMTEADIEFAEQIARSLGYKQTAYTSTSGLWGLFCLPDHARHKHGCIIKTAQFGFLFIADLEDMQLHELAEKERALAV
jgi:hypothetical protein